jgi:methylphosphotriester-DNA--protein-cysteine methyltransferase
MHLHSKLQKTQLWRLIHQKDIRLAANRQQKIYGTLSCKSGKRLKKENRVFFQSEQEALSLGFRPCGHCLRTKYEAWKEGVLIVATDYADEHKKILCE